MFIKDKELVFKELKESISKEQIKEAIPFNFDGLNHFVNFYLKYNGLYFPNGAEIRNNDDLEIEIMYDIHRIKKYSKDTSMLDDERKDFFKTHFPFARDAAGNEYYIEKSTGIVKYISSEFGLTKGLTEVTSSFECFCELLQTLEY